MYGKGSTEMTTAEAVLAAGRDELTPAEAAAYVEEQIQKHLGMTLIEFRRAAEDDELPDDPMVVHLALLAGVHLHAC